MNDSKRHHYIPRFYLRRFADQKEHVRAYRRTDAKHVPKMSITNAAVEVGFYDTVDESGETTDEAEKILSEIEQHLAPALNELVESWPPSDETKRLVAGFVGLQASRTREIRHTNQALAQALARNVKEALEAQGEKMVAFGDAPPIPLDGLEEALTPDQTGEVLMTFQVASQLTRLFYLRSWMLLRSKKRLFITSDSPVIATDVDPDPNSPYGIGYGTADGVFLPIDSNHLLIMWRPGFLAEQTIDLPHIKELAPAIARDFSGYVAAASYEWLFSDPRSSVLDHIELPKQARPLGSLSGLGANTFTEIWGPGHSPQ